jgi:predicted aldo/keto reductase-like oxidoreductase
LDWDLQDAKAKVNLLNAYNIPIWVMEPVRGGALAGLDPAYEEKLKALRPQTSVVEWAFRFLQSIPGVVVTLSGMSNMQQLQENIATYTKEDLLNDEERATLFQVARAMIEKKTLPCTSCKYCVTHCPMELDIPLIIQLYNEHSYTGGGFLAPMVINSLPDEKKPAACLGCRACEGVCPQNIKISEMMADFTAKLKK